MKCELYNAYVFILALVVTSQSDRHSAMHQLQFCTKHDLHSCTHARCIINVYYISNMSSGPQWSVEFLILIQILFNLGKPLAMRLLFKAPRLQYRQTSYTHTQHITQSNQFVNQSAVLMVGGCHFFPLFPTAPGGEPLPSHFCRSSIVTCASRPPAPPWSLLMEVSSL